MKFIYLAIIVFLSNFASAQDIKTYEWDAKPVFEKTTPEQDKLPAVILFDKKWIHSRTSTFQNSNFIMNHFAVKINKADAINKYNKVKADNNNYIRSVKDFHARIIKPDGQILLIPESSIVETDIQKVKSIVFEGVQEGDILEYYFILKEYPDDSGYEIFQNEVPVLYAEMTFSSDAKLFKVIPDSVFKNKIIDRKTIYFAENIQPYTEESNSRNIKYLQKIVYKLTDVAVSKNWKIINNDWELIMPMFNTIVFSSFSKQTANKLFKKLELKPLNTEEKLLKLDNFVKDNFTALRAGEEFAFHRDLSAAKLKMPNSDIFALYSYYLKKLKIPYDIVVAVNRFYGDVSKTIYMTPLPHEVMFYIPETQKYISPYDREVPYGNPIYSIQGSTAIKYTPKKGLKSICSTTISVAPSDFTIVNTQSEVSLNDDQTGLKLKKSIETTGYLSHTYRDAIKYFRENPDKETEEGFVKDRSLNEINAKLLSSTYENTEFKFNYLNVPFRLLTNYEITENIIENAGEMLIINLGKVIGKQTDLYQEKERLTNIDLLYTKTYKHSIVFNIPKGYSVYDYKEFEIQKRFEEVPSQTCWFVSTVKQEGNKLFIQVEEAYNSITYQKKYYEEYRKVVNAAADFYKAALVLKPISSK